MTKAVRQAVAAAMANAAAVGRILSPCVCVEKLYCGSGTGRHRLHGSISSGSREEAEPGWRVSRGGSWRLGTDWRSVEVHAGGGMNTHSTRRSGSQGRCSTLGDQNEAQLSISGAFRNRTKANDEHASVGLETCTRVRSASQAQRLSRGGG